MAKRSGRWAVAVLAYLLVAGAGAAQPALDSARVAAAAQSTDHRATILAFYAARAYQPLWTSGGEASAAGRALRTALGRAGEDGLDPADYPLPGRPGSPEAAEVASADALLRFADDLARGRVDPARVHGDWDAERRRLDARHVLRLAAARGPEAALAHARPPHEAYARLRAALARYHAYEQAGGWPPIPPGPVLRSGDVHPHVSLLRARLAVTGELGRAARQGEHYDAELEEAVRRTQARHGIATDGAVGPATRAALNVSAADRARQIALNMERWRWLPADLGPTHLHVNAAGMWIELVEGGERVLRRRAIVGTLSDPTPGFSSEVTHVVFSPYWNVPESIARAEIRPRLARDPGYLARNHMRVLSGGQVRQDPGPDNPLGPVKFIFENRFDVRLHGTAAPSLFDQRVRAFSHGCIRVEEPLVLAVRLVRSPEWDEARARTFVARREERWVRLPTTIPIHVAYWTAWAEDDGAVQFYDDLYGRDRALAEVMPN